jgi:hypothetical protein
VKYADDFALISKEETVLQSMIDKLIEIGRCYGMEMNVEKTKVMRISRQPFPVTIMIGQKQLGNVECFRLVKTFEGLVDCFARLCLYLLFLRFLVGTMEVEN